MLFNTFHPKTTLGQENDREKKRKNSFVNLLNFSMTSTDPNELMNYFGLPIDFFDNGDENFDISMNINDHAKNDLIISGAEKNVQSLVSKTEIKDKTFDCDDNTGVSNVELNSKRTCETDRYKNDKKEDTFIKNRSFEYDDKVEEVEKEDALFYESAFLSICGTC